MDSRDSTAEKTSMDCNSIPYIVTISILGVALLISLVMLVLLYRRLAKKKKEAKKLKDELQFLMDQKRAKTLASSSLSCTSNVSSHVSSNVSSNISESEGGPTSTQKTSGLPVTVASSKEVPLDTITSLLKSPDNIDAIFAQNEVECLEAEIPHKPLVGPPRPAEGLFTTFKNIGVSFPARVFDKTFGEFDLDMAGQMCTVQYEDMECGLNRIDAIAAVMRQGHKYQMRGTIQDFISTAHLNALNFRLLVVARLGPSIEKNVLSGRLILEEQLILVSLTFQCMEDLLFSNIVHRDIKPASFRYDFSGSKIMITHFGLARIPPKSPRPRIPFFGNPVFCSPTAHLKLERTHFDDMMSWFFVLLFIFNRHLPIWKSETDRTLIYQLKVDLLEEKLVADHLERYIKDETPRKFLAQLHKLISKLPDMQKMSYRKLREAIEMENSKRK
ncbi:unnamed protein product [Bursaphelenchus xylophilus]|uniref:(pine wood nematode) hypothetical protein n=1 Tax=Bursaphelenchus xylophilus TaxID=6326 RepID=A0A1I7RV16_BURXY|nr:unnamed protein product [Bursaphelenchus xylophilus]CAG9105208.1 unnamed protein product [Bursaphelenchus xylophilus]